MALLAVPASILGARLPGAATGGVVGALDLVGRENPRSIAAADGRACVGLTAGPGAEFAVVDLSIPSSRSLSVRSRSAPV